MNALKKIFGIVWIALAILTAYECIDMFGGKFSTGKNDDLIFGIIIFGVLLPLVFLGLLIFGWYALKDEYKD
jgi:tryptophan-rich sensory protein